MERIFSLILSIVILFRSVAPVADRLSFVDLSNEISSVQAETVFDGDNSIWLNSASDENASILLSSISDDYYSDAQLSFSAENEIDVDAPEGWSLYKTMPKKWRPVIVAIIDTGVDYQHEDLAKKIWVNKDEIPDNGIDDDENGYIDDVYGWNFCDNTPEICSYVYDEETESFKTNPDDNDNHGTHIAGIIAAEADNGIGVAGLAAVGNVQIMTLKIHGGAEHSGNIASAIEAINYAESMGASICNISWGTYMDSKNLYKTIANSSMLFCCAAGNNGSDNDIAPIYPACYDLPNVISVTTAAPSGKLATKANYGIKTVDIAVPASEVYSTVVGDYAYMGGSSMAAPHISAIGALLLTLEPNFSASDVKKLILMGAKPVNALQTKIKTGGIASLYNSLVASTHPFPDEIPPTFNIDKKYTSEGIQITIDATDEGGSGLSAVRYFIGERSLEDFEKGTSGLTFDINNQALLQKPGKYTFYALDGDGNETIKTYLITEDTLAPSISNLYAVAIGDYEGFNISGTVADSQSGVKSLKYIKGIHGVEDFSAADAVKVDFEADQFSFEVEEEGIYTIFARDNNGNKSAATIRCYNRKAYSIDITRKQRELALEESITLRPTVVPVFTTDKISYKSSDKSVCRVSSDGTITAVGYGTATITAKTTSGCSDTIEIIVKDLTEGTVKKVSDN